LAPVPEAGAGARQPLILVPTYDERENLDAAIEAIFAAQPGVDVCVIDDASPDGTGDLADAWAARDPRVHVLHRRGKEGLGRAYLDGFRWALDHPRRFTHVVQMDADGSHDARYLGDLFAACDRGADLALGSRWVDGGGVRNWGAHRKLISARTVLGVPVRDLTGGFKCFKRHVLDTLPLHEIGMVGYGFQIEVTYRVLKLGFIVVEVPIVFPDRVRGASKMSARIFAEGLVSVWRLRLDR
jgi:dolichol-phosphate mannosyltransferase